MFHKVIDQPHKRWLLQLYGRSIPKWYEFFVVVGKFLKSPTGIAAMI